MYYLILRCISEDQEFYNVCMTKIWNVPTQKSTRKFVMLEKKKHLSLQCQS